MSTPQDQTNITTQQDRVKLIKAVRTPLNLATVVVLVLELLFGIELTQSNKYIPIEYRFWVIIVLVLGLFAIVSLAFLFTKRAEDIASKATVKEVIKDLHFTGLITKGKGLPVSGATVTLLKNNQQVGEPKQTAMMGDTAFYLPVDVKDEVRVKVERPTPNGNESREAYLVTPGYQYKFYVEF